MKIRNESVDSDKKEEAKKPDKRDQFWDLRCKNEPGYQGCKVYEL